MHYQHYSPTKSKTQQLLGRKLTSSQPKPGDTFTLGVHTTRSRWFMSESVKPLPLPWRPQNFPLPEGQHRSPAFLCKPRAKKCLLRSQSRACSSQRCAHVGSSSRQTSPVPAAVPWRAAGPRSRPSSSWRADALRSSCSVTSCPGREHCSCSGAPGLTHLYSLPI